MDQLVLIVHNHAAGLFVAINDMIRCIALHTRDHNAVFVPKQGPYFLFSADAHPREVCLAVGTECVFHLLLVVAFKVKIDSVDEVDG